MEVCWLRFEGERGTVIRARRVESRQVESSQICARRGSSAEADLSSAEANLRLRLDRGSVSVEVCWLRFEGERGTVIRERERGDREMEKLK